MMTKLTDHFTLEELTFSETAARHGIKNEVPEKLMANLRRTADLLERVRVLLNRQPLMVHSCYRNPIVNGMVGGSKTSAHVEGLAADITCHGYGSPYSIANAISKDAALMADIDQCCLEYGWVHIGLARENQQPRHNLLTKRSADADWEQGILA